jgi:hypothetical protein
MLSDISYNITRLACYMVDWAVLYRVDNLNNPYTCSSNKPKLLNRCFHKSVSTMASHTRLWAVKAEMLTEQENRFKNRKGQVALKHLSMMETVVNWRRWIRNVKGKGSKNLDKASLDVWKELTTQVDTIYAKHAGKITKFNYM